MIRLIPGDALEHLRLLPGDSVHCCVTSPPYYGLRDYGVTGQIGLEPTPDEYIAALVAVFREVRRVLRKDGTLWLNIGDSYATRPPGRTSGDPMKTSGLAGMRTARAARDACSTRPERVLPIGVKHKDLLGMPWMLAFALRADGWYLRQDIIWSKPNPMPESVADRCTKAHEYLFLLSRSERYWFDAAAIAETSVRAGDIPRGSHKYTVDAVTDMRLRQGLEVHSRTPVAETRNKRSVWTVASEPFSDWTETAHQVRVEADAPVDGKKRKASPDCPIHADQSDLVSKASYGGRVAARSNRNGRSGSDPAQAPQFDFAPIETLREPAIAQRNSDLPALPYSVSASGHSIESHRTAHAPATNPACMPCGGTASRIDDKREEPGSIAPHPDMPANSIAAAGLAGNRSNQILAGIAGTQPEPASFSASRPTRCTCEWYVETIEKTSHFATFPSALIEPCILAGCPRGGTVIDPFAGAGTTGLVADRLGRDAILIELNPAYSSMTRNRIANDAPLFVEFANAAD